MVISEDALNLLQTMDVLDEKAKEILKSLSKTEIIVLNDLLDKLRG